MTAARWLGLSAVLVAVGVVLFCSPSSDDTVGPGDGSRDDAAGDGEIDVPLEGGADADADADGAGDIGDVLRESSDPRCPVSSYIWISNTGEGTLSKLCTVNGVELARYYTSSVGRTGDPSRTSVNLHGDMVVTNRDPETSSGNPRPSSVTKFAAELEDCVDREGDTSIDTSHGPTELRSFLQDDCMIWHTTLPNDGATDPIGARATAWDGKEDIDTGRGGSVWIGAFLNNGIYQLDGDTGEILRSVTVPDSRPYGGAIDPDGNFWTVQWGCTDDCVITRVNTETLAWDQFTVPCGYGITADGEGNIWTAGKTSSGSCVNRFHPATETSTTYNHASGDPNYFYRGIAVDNGGSVWVANTLGTLVQVRASDVGFVTEIPVGEPHVVGVAIDYEENVWTVSQGGNEAEKINPSSHAVERFPVGLGPYTYSDMTGYQLRSVVIIF